MLGASLLDDDTAGYQPQNSDYNDLTWDQIALDGHNTDFTNSCNADYEYNDYEPPSQCLPSTSGLEFMPNNILDQPIDQIQMHQPPLLPIHCMRCDILIDPSLSLPGQPSPHLKLCGLQKDHKCMHCGMGFNKPGNLRVHEILQHSDSCIRPNCAEEARPHACELCPRTFVRQKALFSHYTTHIVSDEFQCSRCRHNFEFKVEYLRHTRWSACSDHAPPLEQQIVFCPDCSTTLVFASIALHIRQHAILKKMSKKPVKKALPDSFSKPRPHKCEICDKPFRRPAELKRHLRIHSTEKTFACSSCNKLFKHERGLQMHVDRDHANRREYCPFCQSPFKSQQAVERHVRSVHPLGDNTSRQAQCELCGASFGNIGALSVHLRHQHSQDLPFWMRKSYLCPYCQKSFRKNRDCIEHIRCHLQHREHRCKRCGKKFMSRSGLKIHIETHLRQEGDPTLAMHRCGDCFKLLSSADALRRHRAIHQVYQCRHCGAKLQSSVRLRHHEEACLLEVEAPSTGSLMQIGDITTTPRPASVCGAPQRIEQTTSNLYSCRKCHLSFRSFAAWRTHNRIHNGKSVRPHICWLCHKAFATLHSLQRHKEIHQREKPVLCNECGQTFRNRSRWIEHFLDEHPNARTADEHRPTSAIPTAFDMASAPQQPIMARAQSVDLQIQQAMMHYGAAPLMGIQDQDFNMQAVQAMPENTNLPQAMSTVSHPDPEEIALQSSTSNRHQSITITGEHSKSFHCAACETACEDVKLLIQHLKQSTEDEAHCFAVFSCHLCLESRTGASVLIQHFEKEHGLNDDAATSYAKNVTTVKKRGSLNARQSNKRLQRLGTALKSNSISASDIIRVHRCLHCDKEFVKKSDIERHVRVHTGTKPFTCEKCSRSFSTSYNLRAHERHHIGDQSFVCTMCSKSFYHVSSLKAHMRTHSGIRPLECQRGDCSETFATSYERQRHAEWHSINDRNQPPLRDAITSASVSTEDNLRSQFERTVSQISRLPNNILKVHVSSAFTPLSAAAQQQNFAPLPTSICITVSQQSECMYAIDVDIEHRHSSSSILHLDVETVSLQAMPNPAVVAIYKFVNMSVCISTANALRGMREGLFPFRILCAISPSADFIPNGRIIWLNAPDDVQMHASSRPMWLRECTVCAMQFATESESRAHFAGEDHETAMLTFGGTRRGAGLGPSQSADFVNDAGQIPPVVHRGDFVCQICGARHIDIELLVAHIKRFHDNHEDRLATNARPTARTAPIH